MKKLLIIFYYDFWKTLIFLEKHNYKAKKRLYEVFLLCISVFLLIIIILNKDI